MLGDTVGASWLLWCNVLDQDALDASRKVVKDGWRGDFGWWMVVVDKGKKSLDCEGAKEQRPMEISRQEVSGGMVNVDDAGDAGSGGHDPGGR
jgi:hypothetical protein